MEYFKGLLKGVEGRMGRGNRKRREEDRELDITREGGERSDSKVDRR